MRPRCAVGLGDVSLGIAAARGIDRAGVTRALGTALEAGLDFVDISAEEDSERLVGEVLRSMRLRDTVIAAARIPSIDEKSGTPTRDVLTERLPPRYVVARVESALRASKLDALPLAQLGLKAAWRTSSAWPELVGTCARLVHEGKVLAWGALVDHIEDDTGELCHDAWLASISIPYSICERKGDAVLAAATAAMITPAEADATPSATTGLSPAQLRGAGIDPMLVIAAGLPAELVIAASSTAPATGAAAQAASRQTPIAVLARRPHAGGALAGTIGPGVRLKPRDDRNAIELPELERIAIAATKLARLVKQLPPVANSFSGAKAELERISAIRRTSNIEIATLAELALRFVVTRGAIALPRLHRHEHVIEAFTAGHLPPLPQDVVEEIDN
jgi:aryl-alcohol dehydrogenase-like predicted oxidoreductase